MSQLWKELHERAYDFKGIDDLTYLKEFDTKIPKYTTGCKRREFWINYVKRNPPVFGDKYFE